MRIIILVLVLYLFSYSKKEEHMIYGAVSSIIAYQVFDYYFEEQSYIGKLQTACVVGMFFPVFFLSSDPNDYLFSSVGTVSGLGIMLYFEM